MSDFARLRDQLHALLLAAPLAASACGPATPARPPVIGNETQQSSHPQRDVAWPERTGCGNYGQWCGPVSQVAKATGADASGGCPPSFQHDDLSFSFDASSTSSQVATGDANACCYSYSDGCVIGRPLLDGAGARVAPVHEGGAWARHRGSRGALEPDAALREVLARGWLDDALLEHASIASFARATLELMAVGAPPALLADCQRAALDEVRHAEGCFGLAARYGGRPVAPGPLPVVAAREPSLARLAGDTFVEGCVAETVATLAATRVLAACQDEEVAALLRRIVRDETRHAALAWRTVAWAVREGGAPVALAVRARAVPPVVTGGEPDPVLLAHGRLDGRTRASAVADAWREIIVPTLEQIVS